MRIFQNAGIYRSYRPRLTGLLASCDNFTSAMSAFLSDRYGSSHILQPVYEGLPSAFFANGDEEITQHLWAREHGMGNATSLDNILLAQIEHHRAEVFYNLDPMRYGDDFLARLPGSVKRTIAWRAAPSLGGRFLKHDIIVNNFPTILDGYRSQGVRAEYFAPSHDPEMDAYAANQERPIDVLFIGTYSRHHRTRAALLEAVAELREEMRVVMHIDRSRLTRLAETPLGAIGPLRSHRRPTSIRAVSSSPVFGRELFRTIGSAKVVINGAIDMAGRDRGNMRVWEALGCGAALLSDEGRYPDGIIKGRHFQTYSSTSEAVDKLRRLLGDSDQCRSLSKEGYEVISTKYSKQKQWARFVELVA